MPDEAADLAPWLTRVSSEWQSTTELLASVFGPFYASQRTAFESGVKNSRVMALGGANHYVFISDAERVTRAVSAFLEQR